MTTEEKREQNDITLFCVMDITEADNPDLEALRVRFCRSEGEAEKLAKTLAAENDGREFGIFQRLQVAVLEHKVRLKRFTTQ